MNLKVLGVKFQLGGTVGHLHEKVHDVNAKVVVIVFKEFVVVRVVPVRVRGVRKML